MPPLYGNFNATFINGWEELQSLSIPMKDEVVMNCFECTTLEKVLRIPLWRFGKATEDVAQSFNRISIGIFEIIGSVFTREGTRIERVRIWVMVSQKNDQRIMFLTWSTVYINHQTKRFYLNAVNVLLIEEKRCLQHWCHVKGEYN